MLLMIGLIVGAYLLGAAGFYAYMQVWAQPEPEAEFVPQLHFQVVKGGLAEEPSETRLAA